MYNIKKSKYIHQLSTTHVYICIYAYMHAYIYIYIFKQPTAISVTRFQISDMIPLSMRYFVGDLVVGYHRWIHGEWDFFGWAERVSWDRVLGGGSRDVHNLSLWFTPWNDHVRTWKMDGWNTSFLLRLPIFRATVDGRNPAPPGINKSKTCVRYHPFWLELGERQSWGGPVLLSHVCVCVCISKLFFDVLATSTQKFGV